MVSKVWSKVGKSSIGGEDRIGDSRVEAIMSAVTGDTTSAIAIAAGPRGAQRWSYL